MKIDEPKTPYAKHYDPTEDEEELRTLDAEDIMVDELDKARAGRSPGKTAKSRDEEIPGLSLGEPEEAVPEHEFDDSHERQKAVHVDAVDEDGHPGASAEEKEKHRKFEEMRKKHYEMKNVASLLGHPEELDAMDEDEEMNGNAR